MAIRSDSAGEQAAIPGAAIDRLEDGEVVRCRNSEAGALWFYRPLESGIELYHEWLGFDERVRRDHAVRMVCNHPAVDVSVVSVAHLQNVRGEADGR